MIEVCLIKDLLFSVFSEAASAPFIPEAVNLIVTAAHELCGMIHGFGAELSVWKDLPWRSLLETSICNGWSFNNFSRSATRRASSLSLHISEHRLLLNSNASRSATGCAGFGLSSLFGTRCATFGTCFNSCEVDVLFATECRFSKRKIYSLLLFYQ